MQRPNSAELWSRARQLNPGGVHSPVRAFGSLDTSPLFIESARGAQLIDTDGNSYTDYCMAFGPLIMGHKHPEVEAEVVAAIRDGWSYGTAERYSLELAELIHAEIQTVDMMRFVNSGTEAVMTALRIARAATGHNRILKFAGCYHGHTDAMLIEAGSGMAGTPSSAGITDGVAADTIVIPLDDNAALEQAFEQYGQTLAAAIIEPLPANYGLLPQRKEFLQTLAALCRKHSALLIFDEVISGFRTGFGGYTELSSVTPDLRTWGKIIGGGFPVGAIAGSRTLMELLAPAGPVYQAGTLSANPVAMRAGAATLRQLNDGNCYAQLNALGEQLEDGIKAAGSTAIVREGSVFWFCATDGARSTAECDTAVLKDYGAFHQHMLEQHIYLAPSPYEVNFLSAAHTAEDIDRLIAACDSWQNEG